MIDRRNGCGCIGCAGWALGLLVVAWNGLLAALALGIDFANGMKEAAESRWDCWRKKP